MMVLSTLHTMGGFMVGKPSIVNYVGTTAKENNTLKD